MEKKTCFVIMPYGGKDEELKNKSKNVYDYIIRPAAEDLGFEVIRQDEAATPGNITLNIVKNLSTADIVIADLTNGKGNVFYELGIRHTMYKKKTILIIDETNDIEFDLSPYQTIKYRLDFNTIDKTRAEIKKGIELRENEDLISDNLVHDALPTLPDNLIESIGKSMQGSDYSDRISNLTQENATLREELARNKKSMEAMQKQLDDAGLSNSDSTWELEDAFQNAEQVMQFSGEQAVLKLQELSVGDDFDKQKFLAYLKKVLQSGEIDISDHYRIAQICKKKGLLPFRRLVLEQAHRYSPFDNIILPSLIDCYTDSAATYPKALVLINDWLGIRVTEGQLSISPEKCPLIGEDQLACLFDTYFALNKYDEVIYLIENYLKKYGCRQHVMLQRNLATAYKNTGHIDEAQKAFEDLFRTAEGYRDPMSHRMYGVFLDSIGKSDLEYEQDEIAIALEPNNYKCYMDIAYDIFDDQYIRDENDKIMKVDRKTAKKAAVPFLFKALEIGGNAASVAVRDTLFRNNCEDALQLLKQQIENQTFPSYDGYNDFPLRYCLETLPEIVKQRINDYQ